MAFMKDIATGMFRAKTQETIDTVRQRLAEAESGIADLESGFETVALACVIRDDYRDAEQLQAQINVRRAHATLLRQALATAEAAEHARQAEAREKQQRATLRAFKAQLARRQQAAEAVEKAVAVLAKEYGWFIDATASAAALVPPGAAGGPIAYHTISTPAVERLTLAEMARASRRFDGFADRPILPGTRNADLGGHLLHTVPALSAAVKEACDHDADTFARSLGLATPKPAPADTVSPSPAAEPTAPPAPSPDAEPEIAQAVPADGPQDAGETAAAIAAPGDVETLYEGPIANAPAPEPEDYVPLTHSEVRSLESLTAGMQQATPEIEAVPVQPKPPLENFIRSLRRSA